MRVKEEGATRGRGEGGSNGEHGWGLEGVGGNYSPLSAVLNCVLVSHD